MQETIWLKKSFNELTNKELYQLLRLRQEVFVVEQDCAYLDADDKDYVCKHLLAYPQEGDLGAYARIVPPKVSFEEVAIGRIISSSKYRGTGLGKELMRQSLEYVESLYGKVPIRLSAQYYLLRFYESFGFQKVSSLYLEDGIPHINMLRSE